MCACCSIAQATYDAVTKTYTYLSPDLWKETGFNKDPYQEHSDYLKNASKKGYKAY
jgi:small subunit ribosomal protein S2e